MTVDVCVPASPSLLKLLALPVTDTSLVSPASTPTRLPMVNAPAVAVPSYVLAAIEAACEIVKSFVDYALHAKFLVRCVVVAAVVSANRVRDRACPASSIGVAQCPCCSVNSHVIARYDARKGAYGQCSCGRGPIVCFGRDGSRLRNRQIFFC